MAHKLLLADDSITIQKVVELVLAEEDFEIRSVSNGEDALKEMTSFQPDIVLADIEMPKMNGYQLCERIKKNPKTATVPVLLLAGAFEPIDEGRAAQAGADDSVIKPFESQELISKINAALTIVSAGGGEEVSVGDMDEDLLAVAEEEGDIEIEAEAEVLAEAGEGEEDLWAMEDIPELSEEEGAGESAVFAEETAMGEAFSAAENEVPREPEISPAVVTVPQAEKIVAPAEVSLPSHDELLRVFEKKIDEKISEFLATLDIRESLLKSLMPLMKDSIEKVLWEVAPELSEKMLKEILQGSIATLTSEVQKVIWETVPDLAGTMIAKEIEKIKSEF